METGTTIDTVVADNRTVPLANPLLPLRAPVPFKGFRYPLVDEAENVLFITDDATVGQQGQHHGIYRSEAADQTLHAVVLPTDKIPGTSYPFECLRGIQPAERGSDFVFNATSEHGGRGLFVWSAGTVTQVARTGDTLLPGETTPLSDVHWGALNGGRVLYVAATGKPGQPVLVLHDLQSGTDRVLLRGGDAIPGHPGETFQYVAHQNWLDDHSVVFRAGAADPYRPTTTKAHDERHGLYGWFNVRWDDPATLDPARLVTIADTDTPRPEARQGERFTDFRSAPVHGGLTAFEAPGATRGIYLSQNGAGPMVAVDSETEMPGLFKGKFHSFGEWPAAVDHGVVFTAAAEGFAGVFLYRADQDMLYVLADNRAPLEGKQITEFEIGSSPMAGNRVAVTVEFKDESTGVYLATIPARAYKRIKAEVAGR